MSSTEAPQPADDAKPPSKSSSKVKTIVFGAIAVVFAIIGASRILTWNDLPGCDSRRAKDTLSNIFQQHKVDATAYDEIKTLTSGKDEITCNAKLSLRDNSKLEIDYKLFRENSDMRLLITRSNP